MILLKLIGVLKEVFLKDLLDKLSLGLKKALMKISN